MSGRKIMESPQRIFLYGDDKLDGALLRPTTQADLESLTEEERKALK